MMKKNIQYQFITIIIICLMTVSCGKDFLELDPRGTTLETNFYQTEEDIFKTLVATYDVLQWGGNGGWTMKMGLYNAASDECYAGGSDASDQPSWVAMDAFTLTPDLGPQNGLWGKGYTGIYRANLVLEKLDEVEGLSDEFVARTSAEAKFLRAYFYFDLVRMFKNIPLITEVLAGDDFYTQTQNTPEEVYAQIEKDLNEAAATFELPATLPPDELGRITKGAVNGLLGKVMLYQNEEGRMIDIANHFVDNVILTGLYSLEFDYGDIFKLANEFGPESVFEVNYSANSRGGWGNFNQTEGNYDVQFLGMRDYVGPQFSVGYGFCPVTEKLVTTMQNDPRYEHTIIDGMDLQSQGASYTAGYQNTDYFIRKYAGLQEDRAIDGEPALNWSYNIREIRYADILLMTAEAFARGGNDGSAQTYLNMVRSRVGLPAVTSTGGALLDAIYHERQLELATEGHRFFDLVRTGRAVQELADQGFVANKNEILPIHQSEIDITEGNLLQNPGY